MNNINNLKSLELTVGDPFSKTARLKARNVNVFYGNNRSNRQCDDRYWK